MSDIEILEGVLAEDDDRIANLVDTVATLSELLVAMDTRGPETQKALAALNGTPALERLLGLCAEAARAAI